MAKRTTAGICSVTVAAKVLPNLKGQTGVSVGKDYITLYKTIDQVAVNLVQIGVHDKDCTDCELRLYQNGKVSRSCYTRGSLMECLKSAEAVSYVL